MWHYCMCLALQKYPISFRFFRSKTTYSSVNTTITHPIVLAKSNIYPIPLSLSHSGIINATKRHLRLVLLFAIPKFWVWRTTTKVPFCILGGGVKSCQIVFFATCQIVCRHKAIIIIIIIPEKSNHHGYGVHLRSMPFSVSDSLARTVSPFMILFLFSFSLSKPSIITSYDLPKHGNCHYQP